ncbi:O-antigen ligase family protein [Lishizhenia sp.]|uniref:O-antigen ligase family protein n=1 Tax=Lishizhenia sp. TaxID=2497594 RepID=UPI00299E219C|nr:O-antigen ligase family protein [Lishizhenia sp.]MDX1445047.1 O-antigen ligase family protein [Lishizhenia sp.]
MLGIMREGSKSELKQIWKIEYLFIFTMLSVLVGSKMFGISLPGFTLNLSMILLFICFFIFFKKVGFNKKVMLYGAPIVVLALYSCLQLFYVEGVTLAIVEVRSLLMMALTVVVALYARVYFQKRLLYVLLSKVFWTLFIMLTLFGLFEYFTGIHIWATGIDTILDFKISDFTFAPRFIWGNPNNFITAFLVVSAGIVLVDTRLKQNVFKQFLILIGLFFFSDIAQSKFGIISSVVYTFYLFYLNKELLIDKLRSNKLTLIIAMAMTLGIVLNANWFLGPKFGESRDYFLNEVLIVNDSTGNYEYINKKKLNEDNRELMIKRLKFAKTKRSLGSTELRVHLIKNGLQYYLEEPIFGIGPGQYQYKTRTGQNKYYVGSLQGSHHFVMDIISQYGLIGISFLLIYTFWIVKFMFNGITWDRRMASLISLIFIFCASNLPSKFSSYEYAYLAIAIITLVAFKPNLELDENRL